MFFMRALCTVILAIGYTTATGDDIDAPLDLSKSDRQSLVSTRAASLIDLYKNSYALPRCNNPDWKTASKYYGKNQCRAVAVLLNGCEILGKDNPKITLDAFDARRRMLRESFKALLESKEDGNEYQKLAKEIIGLVAKKCDESVDLSDYSTVYKWVVNKHFILRIRPTPKDILPSPRNSESTHASKAKTDVTVDVDAILGKSDSEYQSALDEKLKTSPNGLPFCDNGIYKFTRAKSRFFRPVAIVLFLCEPTLLEPSKLAETRGALGFRRFGLRRDFNDLLTAKDLNSFEQKAKNVIEQLSIIDCSKTSRGTFIDKLVDLVRPLVNKGQLSTATCDETATLIDEPMAVTRDPQDTNRSKGSPIIESSLEGKRKQTRTNVEINAETFSVSEEVVGQQAVPESVPVQNKGKGLSHVSWGSGYTWHISGPQNNFGSSTSPPNNPSTQQYPPEPVRYRPQGTWDQISQMITGNLPDSAGQIMRPTAVRPNSGRTRSTDNNRQEINEHTSRQSDDNPNHSPFDTRPSKRHRLENGSRFTINSIIGESHSPATSNQVQSSSKEESQDP